MNFCEMSVRVQDNPSRAGKIVYQGTIKEGFIEWWCHLVAVCVLCCLDLLWDGHDASGDGEFPWVLWYGGRDTQLWREWVFRTRRLVGVPYPVNINVVIDGISV